MPTASGHTSAIRAKKVIGTNVKDPSGKKIGEIEDVMLDKLSNNIMFAVVGFGGFLGMAEKYHPIPWSALHYSDGENAYVVNYTKAQLQAAPAASIDELTSNDGEAYRNTSYDSSRAERYWSPPCAAITSDTPCGACNAPHGPPCIRRTTGPARAACRRQAAR